MTAKRHKNGLKFMTLKVTKNEKQTYVFFNEGAKMEQNDEF